MRKAIEDKSPLAAWATLARDEAQMSVEEVVDALAARGHSVKAATIRGIEGGSKGASARLRKLMAEVYGTKPPGVALESPQTPADLSALVTALEHQTKAINDLLARFDSLASEAIQRGVAAALAEAAERRGGGGSQPEQHSRQLG